MKKNKIKTLKSFGVDVGHHVSRGRRRGRGRGRLVEDGVGEVRKVVEELADPVDGVEELKTNRVLLESRLHTRHFLFQSAHKKKRVGELDWKVTTKKKGKGNERGRRWRR